MVPNLSANTKAALLLTGRLLAGNVKPPDELLSPKEYRALLRFLRSMGHEPGDLIVPDGVVLLEQCPPEFDRRRIERLLSRGFLLSQVVENWTARSIWVIGTDDPGYPIRYRQRLDEVAPTILYGCGNISILDTGGLAIVGSRDADDDLVSYTVDVAQLMARENRTVVSGGARGIDHAAMRGALEAGGCVCGVLSDSLEKAAVNRENRTKLMDGRLVLISPFDPAAIFHVGSAMQRNKLIYALSDAALVVNSDINKGGTWHGATEQLEKLKFVPVFIRSTLISSPGLSELEKKGAIRWPNPRSTSEVCDIFRERENITPQQMVLVDSKKLDFSESVSEDSPSLTETIETSQPPPPYSQVIEKEISYKDRLQSVARDAIIAVLAGVMKESEVADKLGITPSQVRIWLQDLAREGVFEKVKGGYSPIRPRLF